MSTASRSIGTQASYSTGTVDVDVTGLILTLHGGTFVNWGEGDAVTVDGFGDFSNGFSNGFHSLSGSLTSYVLSVDSPTQITLQTAMTGFAGVSVFAYSISRAYSTLALWIADCPSDLTAVSKIWKGVMYADSAFTGTLTISGITTSSSYYVWLTANASQRHNGTAYAGGVLIDRTGQTGTAISNSVNYTVIEWFILKHVFAASGTVNGVNSSGTNCTIKNIVGYDLGVGGAVTGATVNGINVTGDNSKVYKIVIYGYYSVVATNTVNGINIAASNVALYNISQYGLTNGLISASGTGSTAINIYCGGNAAADFVNTATWGTAHNNVSSDTTAPGTLVQTGKAASAQFKNISAGTEDFNLKAGSACIARGFDESAIFTLDIAQKSFSVPWDIGAFNYTLLVVLFLKGGNTLVTNTL